MKQQHSDRQDGVLRSARRHKHNKSAIAVASAAAAAAIFLVTAAPAQAAQSNCPASTVCLWEDTTFETNGSGTSFIKFQRYIPQLGTWDYLSTTISGHDTVTSAYNNASWDPAFMWKTENYQGGMFTLSAGAADSNFANGTPAGSFNDSLDSAEYESER